MYNYQDAEGGSIDEAILNAVFEGSKVTLESKLRQGKGTAIAEGGRCGPCTRL